MKRTTSHVLKRTATTRKTKQRDAIAQLDQIGEPIRYNQFDGIANQRIEKRRRKDPERKDPKLDQDAPASAQASLMMIPEGPEQPLHSSDSVEAIWTGASLAANARYFIL